MFGTVKKILGIEGVKLELILPTDIVMSDKKIVGLVKLTSLSDKNIIENIHLVLVEKYHRGRGERKLINEYTMGDLTLKEPIIISKNDVVEIPFEMSFITAKSPMDKMGDNNFLVRGLVALAKKVSNVSSTYSLTAEAKVKGTTLSPFDKKVILFK